MAGPPGTMKTKSAMKTMRTKNTGKTDFQAPVFIVFSVFPVFPADPVPEKQKTAVPTFRNGGSGTGFSVL